MSARKKLSHDEENERLLDEATDYAVSQSDGRTCPFCSAEMNVGEDANTAPLRRHLRAQHPARLVKAYLAKDVEADVRPPDPEPATVQEAAGIRQQDTYDRFDALYVPGSVKHDAEKAGDHLRWVAPYKFRRMLDQGAQMVPLPKDEADLLPRQGSTEDSTLRANEMRLMRIPKALADKYRRQKEARIEQNLQARKEDLDRAREGVEKAAYDFMIKEGHDKQTAIQVARAIARGESRGGDWRAGDPHAHSGITIKDKRGETRLA